MLNVIDGGTHISAASQQPAPKLRLLLHVTAPSDPGVLPRLLGHLAKLSLVPYRVHASREHHDGSELNIEIRIAGLEAARARRIESTMRSIIGVRQVLAVIEPDVHS